MLKFLSRNIRWQHVKKTYYFSVLLETWSISEKFYMGSRNAFHLVRVPENPTNLNLVLDSQDLTGPSAKFDEERKVAW